MREGRLTRGQLTDLHPTAHRASGYADVRLVRHALWQRLDQDGDRLGRGRLLERNTTVPLFYNLHVSLDTQLL